MTTMADSRHPYERATGGKGDRDIRTDPKKYREAKFWEMRDARLKGDDQPKTNACARCGNDIETPDESYCDWCRWQWEKEVDR